MKAMTDEALQTAQDTVVFFNSTTNRRVKDNLREKLKHDLNSLYMKYDKENDQFIINDILPKLELYNYQVNQLIYKSGLSVAKGYDDNGIETVRPDYIPLDDTISTKKQSFKEAFLQYADMVAHQPHVPALIFIEQQQPLVKVAYEKLGVEKVRSLRYVKKSVEAALKCLDDDKTTEQNIARMMVDIIPVGATITVSHANDLMQ